MSDKYYDHQHGIEYNEWEYPIRRFGCIPSSVQAERAFALGVKSDEQKIAELAAPWDKSDQPAIIQWNEDWKKMLEEQAEAFDKLRDEGLLPPIWEMAEALKLNLQELCLSLQLINDCAAWAVMRAFICRAIIQAYFGNEIDIEKINPSGLYTFSSGETPRDWERVPDNGRTIYAVAESACKTGNFPASAIGAYTGDARFTPLMIKSVKIANENQLGFVYVGSKSAEELADIVLLSLRAGKPVVIGNSVALRDGTHQSADGVYVSDVNGSWGGGHATAAVDVKKVGDRYYPFIYNSHGKRYNAPDGRPAEGTYITREGLVRYLSGSFADIMPTTYAERPRVEYYDLYNFGRKKNG